MAFNPAQNFSISTHRTDDYCISTDTGEIIGQYVSSAFTAPPDPVRAPKPETVSSGSKYRLSPQQTQDAMRLLSAANDSQNAPAKPQKKIATMKSVTRPFTVMHNPLHRLIALADVHPEHDLYDLPAQNWVEDYVMAACYTVAKTSKGKLNVSPQHVYTAVKMPDISTAAVRNATGLGKSQGSLVAQCARHALDGMMMYLEHNQQVQDVLQAELDYIDDCTSVYADLQQANAA
ncbi:hypothetical protein D3C81_787070 [compost metagenome]